MKPKVALEECQGTTKAIKIYHLEQLISVIHFQAFNFMRGKRSPAATLDEKSEDLGIMNICA